jgi:outer membrane immunogenic protein
LIFVYRALFYICGKYQQKIMNNFKKLSLAALMILTFSAVSVNVNAQNSYGFAPGDGFKQLNFGLELEGIGIPVYAGMDFGVSDMITIGPRVSFATDGSSYTMNGIDFDARTSVIIPSFRGDYHFSGHIEGLPAELDFYGGLSLGLVLVNSRSTYEDFDGVEQETTSSNSDIDFWIQAGARYFFSDKWAVHLELASRGYNASLGLSLKL